MSTSPSASAPSLTRRLFGRRRTITIFTMLALIASLLVIGASTQPASAGPAPVMTGYVPLPANQFDTALIRAKSTSGTTLAFTVGITNAASGAVIYYDEWEDGYEADIANPVQSTTKVFGDGNTLNGDAADVTWGCGAVCAGDLLPTGSVLKKTTATLVTPRVTSTVVPDGGDKVASTRGFSLVAGGYPTAIGSVVAGVVSSYDTSKYGLDYVVPVGVDTYANIGSPGGTNNSMNTASVLVGAAQANTHVTIDVDGNGTIDETTTLSQGQFYLSTSSVIEQGAHVVADKPVQVHLSTGDTTQSGAPAESRWYTLFPTPLLSSDYLSPVGASVVNQRTILYAYNPNAAPIHVVATCGSGCTPPAAQTIAPGAVAFFATPVTRAMRLKTDSGEPFAAVGANGSLSGHQQFDDASDPGNDDSANFDSGFTLIPTSLLTTQAVLSWAPGNSSNPPSSSASDLDDNPVWITSLDPTTIYVDFDGNPATFRSGSVAGTGSCIGEMWDASYVVTGLTSTKIADTDDGDMTGARIATCDAAGTQIAGAWSEDAAVAPQGAPGFDAGYTIIPTTTMVVDKSAASAVDSNGDGKIGPGDTLQYDVAISDAGALSFHSVVVKDGIPAGTTYVAGSAQFVNEVGTTSAIPDDASGTAFPLDGAGVSPGGGIVGAGSTVHVRYQLTIDNPMRVSQTSVTNTVNVTATEASAGDTLVTPLAQSDLSLIKTLTTPTPIHLGEDATYHVTVTNAGPDAANGVQVTDQIPAGTTFKAASASQGSYDSTTGLWTVGNLGASGPSSSATLDLTVTVNTTSAVTNVAQVTKSGSADPDSQPDEDTLDTGTPPNQDDEGSVSFTPQAPLLPDVSLTKTASSVSYSGDTVTYTVTASNSGAAAATGVVVTDLLPSGIAYTGSTASQGTYVAGTGLWTVGTLAGTTGTATLTITGKPVAPNTYVNTAEVTAQNESDLDSHPGDHDPSEDDQASASITVTGMSIGDRVWYDIDGDGVQDVGEPGISGADVSVHWAGPDGILNNGDDVVTPTTTGLNGTWSVPNLPSGSYVVTTSSLPNGLTNPTFDLDGTGTADVVSFTLAGGTSRTDVDFGYQGSGTVGDTIFRDTNGDNTPNLGEGLDGVTVNARWAGPDDIFGNSDDIAYPSVVTAGGGLYSFGDLPIGKISITVASGLPGGVVQTVDPDSGNDNTSTVTLTAGQTRNDQDFGYVDSRVNLSILKSDGGTSTTPGGTVAYTLSYGNGSGATQAATGVVITETVPANVTFNAGASTAGWVCTPNANAGSTCTYAVGPVAVSGTGSVTFAVTLASTVPAGTTLVSNTATIADDTTHGTDTDPSDNSSSDTTPVTAAPDLTITKSDGGASVSPGGIVTYTLDYTNAGNQGATGVVLTETVPVNSTFIASSSTAGWGCLPDADAGATCTFNVGTVAAGGSGSVTFAVRAAYPLPNGVTQLANTATIADDGGNGPDPTPLNNTSTDTTPIQTGTVGDQIYLDVNGNNAFDAGEGIANVQVDVVWAGPDGTFGTGDDVSRTTTTDVYGVWTMTDLPLLMPLRIDVNAATLPVGLTNTVDPDGVYDDTSTVTLAAGLPNLNQDFGYRGTGSIGDFVWRDIDGDGVQDSGEPGLPNVGLTAVWAGPDGNLGTTADNQSWTTTTNGSGSYAFSNVPAGTFTVTVTGGTPAGSAETFDLDGTGTANAAAVVLTAGQNRTDVDFGYRSGGVVGDTVFLDLNGNGTQDVGDNGVSGATVTLLGDYDNNGSYETTIGTTTTDSSGNYSFTGVDAVPVRATVTVPTGYSNSTPINVDHTMGTNETFNAADFGILPGSIAGNTWFDDDDNGIFGVGDTPIGTVNVTLYDGSNNVVATTTTDGSGNYVFRGLAAGSYTVGFTAPTGQVFTIPNVGADDTVDSDAAPTTGRTGTIVLSAGQSVMHLDAGLYDVGSLAGTVYADTDNDGVLDVGETGIAGVTVTLTGTDDLGNPVNASTTTDSNGNWTFTNLRAGTYTATETQPSGVLDGKDTAGSLDGTVANDVISGIDITPGDDGTGYLFGELPATSLSGTVFDDGNGNGLIGSGEPGISGVTVTLTGTDDLSNPVSLSTVTDGNGNYTFTNLRPGTYTVTETQPSPYVDGTDTAGTSGGTAGAIGTDSITGVVLSAGVSATGNNFGEELLASIGDTVFGDTDGSGVQNGSETGLPNVALTLAGTDAHGTVVSLSTTTNGTGIYSFPGLRPGTYTVTADGTTVPPGFQSSSTNPQTVTPTSGQNVATVDFGFRPPSGTIGDTVFSDTDGDGAQDPGEPGLGNVLVSIAGPNGYTSSALTSGAGTYSFVNLPPGAYTVTVTQPSGLTPTTATTMVRTIAQDQVVNDVDFGFTPPPAPPAGTIGDRVWNDANGNGLQDPGELGVGGATVTLRIDSNGDGTYETVAATQVTAADGSYSFGNLPPSSYEIVVTVPAGQFATTPTAIPVMLTSGQVVDTADFGLRSTPPTPGTIGDTVYDDISANGVQDGGEVGFSGATVTLRQDTDGDGIYEKTVGTTITASDGSYSFTYVPTGLYIVRVTVPGLYTPTTPTTFNVSLAAGQTVDTADFGLTDNTPAPGSIDGHVWNDTDRDQVLDAGEPGVNVVTVTLLQDQDGDGTFEATIATTTTAGNGNYSFPTLPSGRYHVVVTSPAGQSVTTVGSYDVNVAPGQDVHDIDFGLATPASVPFDLQLTKTEQGQAVQGEDISWLLTATNNGINPTPNPVTLTDVLPSGLTYVSGTGTGWSCTATGQTVTCTLAQSLPVGASTNLTIVTTVGSGVVPGTQLTNNATVAANGVELTLTNNSDDAFADVLASEVDAPTPTPTPTTVPPATPTTGSLPATGSDSARLALFALMLVGAGATLLGLRRRQQR